MTRECRRSLKGSGEDNENFGGRARTLKVTIRNLNISCDISYDLQSDDGVNGDKFMNQLEPVISRIPYMVVAGNHEYEDGNFTNFRQRFWMPPNDYEQNQFYSFDLGPVHWVALSTEYYGYYEELGKQPILAQYNWLVNDLKSANSNRHQTPWIATFSHRPYYCSAAHNDDCSGSDSSMGEEAESMSQAEKDCVLRETRRASRSNPYSEFIVNINTSSLNWRGNSAQM
ncbi:hypothetical protein RB195_002798 [Necator americanus]|uniref:Calcineurin-like phosphoesterase domain-containing protein n=1 Tax=Necator americanus TaxID=51031 RepID=A0ABR1DL58_NECAM